MRKSIFYVFILFAAMSAVSSCTTDREDSAYITRFTFRTPELNQSGGLVYTHITDSANSMRIEFYGKPIQENYLFIHFNKTDLTTPGTYQVGFDPATHRYLKMVYYTNASHEYTSTTGSLTITKVDNTNKLISGTFKFTGMYLDEAKYVSAGTFENIGY